MGDKILVTGGAGYIGSHVVKKLGEAGFEIIILDNLSTGNKQSITYGELVVGDLADTNLLNELMKKHNFTGVMHFAGSIKVPESVVDPLKYYRNNSRNTFNLIEACIENNVHNFIFSSTAAVYGLPENGIAIEEGNKNPINPYGNSKLISELMLQDTANAINDFNYIALRYFNVSGADMDGKIGQAFPEPFHLINLACEAATGKREKLNVFGTDYDTPDGTCVRDYIHVVDLADAHVKAMEHLIKNRKSQVLNCGYGHGYSVKEVISAVKEVTGINFKVEETERRAGDPAVLISKAQKIKDTLGWQPNYDDLSVIIKSAYEWESSDTLKQWRD